MVDKRTPHFLDRVSDILFQLPGRSTCVSSPTPHWIAKASLWRIWQVCKAVYVWTLPHRCTHLFVLSYHRLPNGVRGVRTYAYFQSRVNSCPLQYKLLFAHRRDCLGERSANSRVAYRDVKGCSMANSESHATIKTSRLVFMTKVTNKSNRGLNDLNFYRW